MCIALVGLCASAQEKGDMAVGLNLGVAPCLESGPSVTNFGIGVKFQYNISNPIRLEAAFDYGFKNKWIDVISVGVNAHYIVKLGKSFSIYPVAGIGYARLGAFDLDDYDFNDWFSRGTRYDYDDYDDDDEGSSANKFYFNVGVGGQYNIGDNLAINLEIKYQYIKYFNRLPINIGISYRF